MDNTELISKSRELCENSHFRAKKYLSGEWITYTDGRNCAQDVLTLRRKVFQLCDALEAARNDVERLNHLHKREIIVTGEYAQRVIDLTARAEKAEQERDEYKTCSSEWEEAFNNVTEFFPKYKKVKDCADVARKDLDALYDAIDRAICAKEGE